MGVLSLAAPLFLFPKERLGLLFLVIPLLWIIRKMTVGSFLRRTPLDLPILVLLIQLLLVTMVRGNPEHGFSKTAGLLLAVGLYYAAVALLESEKLLKAGLVIFLAGGAGFSLLGFLGMYTFKTKHLDLLAKLKEKLPQIHFNLPGAEEGFSPNAVGGTLLLVIPLAALLLASYLPAGWTKRLGLGEDNGRRLFKPFFTGILIALGLLLMLGVLLLTQSRGAWLGLFASAAIVGLWGLRKRKKILGAILIIVLAVSAVLVPALLKWDPVQLTTRQAEGTMLFRLQMWDRALPRAMQHPLLGIGLNEFRYLPEIKYEESHAHNKLFHIMVEMGLPALAAYMALLALAGFMAISTWNRARQGWVRPAALGLGAGLLAQALFEMTDVIPLGSKVGLLSWIAPALLSALFLNTKAENK